MPSLNVVNYIEEAIESVRTQTLQEIEIICIDAGSNDGTWEILTKLAAIDERIVLRHSNRKSYGYQVNLGIDMAKGEYIAVLETDDYVDSSMYEELYEKAVLHNCDYVKSDYYAYWTQDNGKRFFVKKKIFLKNELYESVIEPKLYCETATEDWYLWTGIYKRKFLRNYNIRLSETPGAAFQDIGFLFQANIRAKRVLYLKERYYRYCLDRDGASTNSGKGLQYSYQEFSRMCEYADKEMNLDCIRMLYCRMAKSFMCCYEEMENKGAHITDGERKKYYLWFRDKLKFAKETGIIDKNIVEPTVWNKVGNLLVSEECYIEKIEEHGKYIKEIIGEPQEYPVIIFGCGYYGYNAYRRLRKQEYRLAGFMDNNRELWGTGIDDLLIKSPESIEEMPEDTKYVIATGQYSEEIRKQLMDMGIVDENICIYV